MTMHNVTTCPISGYDVMLHDVNCYIIVLQQCKYTCKFYYMSFLSIHQSKNWMVKRYEGNVEQTGFTKDE
jgi:hypothetical protein